MLFYTKGRFYAPNMSFALPDEISFDTDPTTPYEYGISFRIEDSDIECYIYEDADGYSDSLADDMSDQLMGNESFVPYAPIKQTEINGLAAYEVDYHDNDNDYYEVWIELPNANCVKLFAQCPRGRIEHIKEQAQLRQLLQSIAEEE